jgi:hypothetical protein
VACQAGAIAGRGVPTFAAAMCAASAHWNEQSRVGIRSKPIRPNEFR